MFKGLFKNRYRVVTDNYLGYEAQVKFWWFPVVWFQLDSSCVTLGMNTCASIEAAERIISGSKAHFPFESKVVKYVE